MPDEMTQLHLSNVMLSFDVFAEKIAPQVQTVALQSLTLNNVLLDTPEADLMIRQFPMLQFLDLSCNPLGSKILI